MMYKKVARYLFFSIVFCQNLIGAPEDKPRILFNDSNRCYRNATLQCLANAKPLTEFILAKENKKLYEDETKNNQDLGKKTVGKEYQNFLQNHWNGREAYSLQGTLQSAILDNENFGRFGDGVQEDPQELLLFILDKLNLPQFTKFSIEETKQHCVDALKKDCHSKIKEDLAECLTLPILSTEPRTLEQCFKDYFVDEKMIKETKNINGEIKEYDNRWRCEDCPVDRDGKHPLVDATKNIRFKNLPQILMISLSRFNFDSSTGGKAKISTAVTFHEELSMKDFPECFSSKALEESKKVTYKLTGFTIHSGSISGGHHWAYVKHNNKWFYVNCIPQTSESVDISNISTSGIDPHGGTPYLFFYERTDSKSLPDLPGKLINLNKSMSSLKEKLKEFSEKLDTLNVSVKSLSAKKKNEK